MVYYIGLQLKVTPIYKRDMMDVSVLHLLLFQHNEMQVNFSQFSHFGIQYVLFIWLQ